MTSQRIMFWVSAMAMCMSLSFKMEGRHIFSCLFLLTNFRASMRALQSALKEFKNTSPGAPRDNGQETVFEFEGEDTHHGE